MLPFLSASLVAQGPLWSLVIPNATAADRLSGADYVGHESLDDAWWTGPLWASSAATLPQDHWVVEPYLFDSMVTGRYDERGVRHDVAHEDDYSSRIFFYYGLTDSWTIGVIPQFGFNNVIRGRSSDGIGVGDLTVQVQRLITQYQEGGGLPTISVLLAETLPTGKYDQLGNNSSNGLGQGSLTTTASVYSQYFYWLPNGRIVRARLDLSYSWSAEVGIKDTSVFGTPAGFRGRANPGNSAVADLAGEWSITRHWVFAFELIYQHTDDTRVAGTRAPINRSVSLDEVQYRLGSSDSVGVAPAIEYNWTDNLGLIAGAEFVAQGRNTSAAVVPTVAVNCYF
jgi:hypothetical protein